MSIFCKHDYKLISETTTESEVEQVYRLAKEEGSKITELGGFLLRKKFIQVFTCKNCGNLKRFVEDV